MDQHNPWKFDDNPEAMEETGRKLEALGIRKSFLEGRRKTPLELEAELEAAVREMEADPELMFLIYMLAGYEPQTKGNA